MSEEQRELPDCAEELEQAKAYHDDMREAWRDLEGYLEEMQAFSNPPHNAMAKQVRELMTQLLCDKPHGEHRCESCGYQDPTW